jgi:hypothetical protein
MCFFSRLLEEESCSYGPLTYMPLMGFIGTKPTKVLKGTRQGGDLMDPNKATMANLHMQRSTSAVDKPLVSAFESLWRLVRCGTSAIGRRIFWSSDRQAHQHGWQVIPRYGGLSRTYRDPRFDYLATCMTCNGRGRNPRGSTCSDCQGTGRVSSAPDVIAKQRQEQS